MASSSALTATGAPLVSLVTTTEAVALTSNALNVNSPQGQGVLITGLVTGVAGTGATSIQVRVRQGANTITGTTVFGPSSAAVTAGQPYAIPIRVLDTSIAVPSAPSGQAVYSLTAVQVGASGNGTVTMASVDLTVANASGA